MKNSGTLPCMTFTEMTFKGHNQHSKQGFFLYTEAKTQITEIPKLRSNFCQNSVQFVQNSDLTTPWGSTKQIMLLQRVSFC